MVVSAIITNKGEVLVGKKEEKENHPVSGEWIFPGGHLDDEEDIEEALKREVKEETDLAVDVHQLIDCYSKSYSSGRNSMVRIFYHCESSKEEAKAEDDLSEVKWVSPDSLEETLGDTDHSTLENRPTISNFIKKIEKMPGL
ncbi:MAG: NUDIX hydrolase [Candidatus Nanohaloarchaea archaeon]